MHVAGQACRLYGKNFFRDFILPSYSCSRQGNAQTATRLHSFNITNRRMIISFLSCVRISLVFPSTITKYLLIRWLNRDTKVHSSTPTISFIVENFFSNILSILFSLSSLSSLLLTITTVYVPDILKGEDVPLKKIPNNNGTTWDSVKFVGALVQLV